ncbi:MAG: hypothetical protein IJE43_22675 [Alphaproteobacteria bacterium]|nr:hypothetical protein [Alphaproteobacteria bacterium]
MGYTLKLDIYYFSLKKIKEERQQKINNKVKISYITEENECTFGEFIYSLPFEQINQGNYTEILLKDFIKGFNSSFKKNKENTQAISTTDEHFKGFSSKNYTLWGIFKGGPTGINQEIYESDNAIEPTSTIDNSKVSTLYYFYKLWLPYDSNIGILMVQSYTSIGCTSLFKKQLEQYFIQKGHKITNWSKCIPNEYIKKYLLDGYINEIQVIHAKKDKSRPLEPIFSPLTYAQRKEIFNNFNIPFTNLIKLHNYKSVLKSQIKAISTDYNEHEDVVKIFYKDSKGHNAHSNLADIENILPTITLDESLKDENTQQPKWNELHTFTNELLESIKEQISYTPKLI